MRGSNLRILLYLAIMFLAPRMGQAVILQDGSGIVYGKDFSFNVKAPKGWTLDTESGVDQGLHAVFYPNGGSWSDSTVVAYTQSRPKTAQIASADDAAQDTIKKFHSKGSPNYKGQKLKTLKTQGGQDAVIYQFSGDQWGNNELAAYIVEGSRINFFVLNSRDKKAFDQAIPAFEELVKSYQPLSLKVTEQGKPAK